ncbi:MAG: transglutaminase domain-containing protein, partial [Spirochaetales bacterium]|nr:transglutaminase domain-containing protein [Spirochaetales bacterium]
MKQLLFYARLGLYLLAVSLPFLHPAVVVPYDRVGIVFWFVLVPVQMLAAFYLAPPRLSLRAWLILAAAPIAVFALFVAGLEPSTPLYVLGALAAFLLTVLLFRDPVGAEEPGPLRRPRLQGWRGNPASPLRAVAVLEPFALAVVYLRILGFSRASEELAQRASGITQTVMILVPLTFLLHGLVLYLCLHRPQGRKAVRETVLFVALAVPVFLLVSLILPPDFVRHAVVLNRIDRDIRPKPVPLEDLGLGWEDGNLRSLLDSLRGGRELGEEGNPAEQGGRGDREGGRNALEGIPSDRWTSGGSGEGEEGKQYAVMVVASRADPVYAADAYFGELDPVRGFLLDPEEPLNELAYLRFLETWRDPAVLPDRLRGEQEIHYLSTLPERYLAYRPHRIEPTVLQRRYYPFEYSYRTVSRMTRSSAREWSRIGGLSPEEETWLARYLAVPLGQEARLTFGAYLEENVAPEAGYYGRIAAVLRSFDDYQYEVGFDDDTSVAKLLTFLERTKNGDCTEFSNTAAILLRLAGVPARVVTGYLASRELHSFAHLEALYVLRGAIEPLQEFALQELILVTTAQRHSWVQAYLPGFGWVDFESTAYALPPPPGQDPNSMDVVIPLIQDLGDEARPFRFPWLAALELLLLVAAAALGGAYLLRVLRELVLAAAARGHDLRALRALWALLLSKLSARGLELKPPSQTPLEYAQLYPQLTRFASLYTMLRYRESLSPEERSRAWAELRLA